MHACVLEIRPCMIKVTGNVLNIEYYFWWHDYCFGLLIHDDPLFHFMVSISDEYKFTSWSVSVMNISSLHGQYQ